MVIRSGRPDAQIPAGRRKPASVPPCPHRTSSPFMRSCPGWPSAWNPTRESAEARWRSTVPSDARLVAEVLSPYGQVTSMGRKATGSADFDWLICPTNRAKVLRAGITTDRLFQFAQVWRIALAVSSAVLPGPRRQEESTKVAELLPFARCAGRQGEGKYAPFKHRGLGLLKLSETCSTCASTLVARSRHRPGRRRGGGDGDKMRKTTPTEQQKTRHGTQAEARRRHAKARN